MWILDPNECQAHEMNEKNTSGTSAIKWVLFIIVIIIVIFIKLMDNVTPISGHFWEGLTKRCIVAPNKRGGAGGEVIVPKPAGTASALRPVATEEC